MFQYSPHLPFRLAASLVLIGAITGAGSFLLDLNATTVGFAYLIGILAVATAWGVVEAVIASVAAMLCFNYFFLPPIGRFTISDPQNWVALGTFLVTALVASHLSDRARKQTLEATGRQREMEQLYALSRAILLSEPKQSIGFQAVQHIAQTFECGGAALYDAKTGETFLGGAEDLPQVEAKLKQVAIQGSTLYDNDTLVAAVSLGGRPIGSLAMSRVHLSDGALQALLNLVAIALERVRTEEASNRAEVARRSEEFKSMLLDAIAHEFKTPLTSIKAASTSILSEGDSLSPYVREMTQIIDEEANRLSVLVTEAVRMSQVDAGDIHLERQPVVLEKLIGRLLEQFGARLDGREVRREISSGLPQVIVDPDLLALSLRQLIDNGLKYSPSGTPLEIRAGLDGEAVLVCISDHGPGIPEHERERVFDKFYRRNGSRVSVPGSGLGLHIAREIVRAHGGELWAREAPHGGAEFCASIPLQAEVSGNE